MCIMCLEFARDRMTMLEVRRALPELISTSEDSHDKEHYEQLHKMTDEQLKAFAQKMAAEQHDQSSD